MFVEELSYAECLRLGSAKEIPGLVVDGMKKFSLGVRTAEPKEIRSR